MLDSAQRARREMDFAATATYPVAAKLMEMLFGQGWLEQSREISRQWQVAMLVTVVEAYVSDVARAFVEADPSVLCNHQPTASIGTGRLLGAPDKSTLIGELVDKWCSGFVDAGPRGWLEKWRAGRGLE